MPDRPDPKGARTLNEMIEAGLYRRTGYMWNVLRNDDERREYLRATFPQGDPRSIAAAFRRTRRAHTLAQDFWQSGDHPQTTQIDRDPSIGDRGRFAYTVRITYDETVTDSRGVSRTRQGAFVQTLYSDNQLDRETLASLVTSWTSGEDIAVEQISGPMHGREIRNVEIDVLSITRR